MMNNAKLRGRLLVFAFALLLICAFAVGAAGGGTDKCGGWDEKDAFQRVPLLSGTG